MTLLSAKSQPILEKWLEMLLASYHPETAQFLKRGKDPFANPVAHQLARGLKDVLGILLEDQGVAAAQAALDEVVRVTVLQDLPPSQALAFLFFLKLVVREELAEELEDLALVPEMVELESRIDGLALLGFDAYMQRREKLFEIRVDEMKSRISGLLRRSGLDLMNP